MNMGSEMHSLFFWCSSCKGLLVYWKHVLVLGGRKPGCFPCFFHYSLFDFGKHFCAELRFLPLKQKLSKCPYLKASIPFVQMMVIFRLLKK